MAQNDVGVTKLENGNWEYRFVMVVDGKKVTSRKRKDEQGNPLTTKRAALKARKEAMKKAQLQCTFSCSHRSDPHRFPSGGCA